MATSPRPTSPLRLIFVAFALVAVAAFSVFELRYLLIIFAGVLFGVFLHAAAGWLSRKLHLPYGVALALLLLVGAASLTVGLIAFAPTLSEQLADMRQQLPKVIEQLQQKLSHVPLLSKSGAALGGGDKGQSPPVLGAVAAALGSGLEVLGGLVVVFFLGLYGAAQPGAYRKAVLALTPQHLRKRMDRALQSATSNLARWLFGRMVAMIFVGVTTTIAFHFLHVPLAFGLGVLAGFLTFIEYAGAILSAIPPVLLALTQSPAQALWVLALFTALHVIEGYVLTPLLSRATVKIAPGITLVAQVLLGAAAGALGLTLSTPLLVVAVCAAQSFRGHDDEDAARTESDRVTSGVHARPEPKVERST